MQPGLIQVPVFVYPTPVTFYFDDQTSHKQVLTLYNPYEFAVRFRVLCTAPNKYSVVDPEGSIRPRCCIDIVIRHNAVSTANCNVIDKFRIQMHNFSTKQNYIKIVSYAEVDDAKLIKSLIGKQDVAATLLPGKATSSAAESEVFQHLPQRVEYTGTPVQHQFGLTRDTRPNRLQTPNYIVVVAALVCICALLLPTEGDQDTRFPVYLHLTPHLKLIFAYVLGMVTMVVLRAA